MSVSKVAVLFTGGTISMKVDPRLTAAIPALSSEEIMSMVTNIDRFAQLESINYGKLPSPHITPSMMMEIKNIVQEQLDRPDIKAVVITHGTDTLEETAFLLDLTLNSSKPVVLVAAMRNSSELGYDGPSNLSAAICTAISEASVGKGVLIVMNNEVNAAAEVTKSHTLSLDTFKSLEFGPLGVVDNDEVIFYRDILKHGHIETNALEENVHLLKAVAGMDGLLIDYCVEIGAKGIVIEAMGRGNLPPQMANSVYKAIDKGVTIVIVSRCPKGRVLDSYGYEGGGKQLRDRGVIFGGSLNGQKARIKLMLALGATQSSSEIKAYFEKDYYKL